MQKAKLSYGGGLTQGKSRFNMFIIGLCIQTGRKLLLGTNCPQQRYEEILKEYPNAKLKIMENGVMING